MKKLLTIFFILISSHSYAQIGVYKPYLTNGNVMVGDSALFIGKFKLASFTGTNSLGGYADKAGQSFALDLDDNSLSLRSATGTWLVYPNLTAIQALITASTADSLVFRTVSNSFTKAQTNTQIANAVAGKQNAFTSQSANTFYSAPNGSAGVPSFRVIDRVDIQKSFGANFTTGVLDWNDVTNVQPGSTPVLLAGTATNGMGGTSLYHPFNFEFLASKNGTGNITQLAIPYNPGASDGIWYRTRLSGTWSAWKKQYDTSNLNIGLYATIANATFTGVTTAAQFKLSALNTAPASATATGTLGEIRITSGFIYVCIATNTWVRAALTTF